MEQPFIQTHAVAGALVGLTVVAEALVEWTLAPPGRDDSSADRGTKWALVGAIVVGMTLAWWAVRLVPGARMPGSGWIWIAVGVPVMWAGVGVRIWAIATLGRFFRRVVVLQEEHRVVRDGPYRVLRHPAYTGNLLLFLGIGLTLGNWLSLALLLVATVLGHIPRIRVEEAALERGLGDDYRRYEAETRRLVPGLW